MDSQALSRGRSGVPPEGGTEEPLGGTPGKSPVSGPVPVPAWIRFSET